MAIRLLLSHPGLVVAALSNSNKVFSGCSPHIPLFKRQDRRSILPIRNWAHPLRLRRLRLTHLFHHISDPQLVNVNFYQVRVPLLNPGIGPWRNRSSVLALMGSFLLWASFRIEYRIHCICCKTRTNACRI